MVWVNLIVLVLWLEVLMYIESDYNRCRFQLQWCARKESLRHST